MVRDVRKSEHNIMLFSENIVFTMQQSVRDCVPQEEHNLLSTPNGQSGKHTQVTLHRHYIDYQVMHRCKNHQCKRGCEFEREKGGVSGMSWREELLYNYI